MASLPTLFREHTSVPSVFEDFFSDIDRMFNRWGPMFESDRGANLALDVQETDKGYQVEVNVPGAKKDDIDVLVENERLTVAMKKQEEEERRDDSRYIYRERRYASAKRTIELPDASPEGVEARLSDGVLTIEIKKDESKRPRKVDIH